MAPAHPRPDPPRHGRRKLRPSRCGQPIRIRPGDVIVTAPGEWHWHGATPTRFMTHLALTEGDTEWGQPLTDDEYAAAVE